MFICSELIEETGRPPGRAANGSVTHGSMGHMGHFLGWVNGSWVTCHGS